MDTKTIELLAQKLGASSEYLIEIFARRALAGAAADAVLAVIFVALMVLVWRKGYEYSLAEEDDDLVWVVSLISALSFGALLILFIIAATSSVQAFASPEAAAVKEILKVVGSGK